MAHREWYEHPAIATWGKPALLLILVVLIGPGLIGDAASDPSAWNVIKLGVGILAVTVFLLSFLSRWGRFESLGSVDPEDVPQSDVVDALASTSSRVAAIKALREKHPGLGLADAVNLVESERA